PPLPRHVAPAASADGRGAYPRMAVGRRDRAPRRGGARARGAPLAAPLARGPRRAGAQLVGAVPQTVVVVSCFNEAARLDDASFLALAAAPGIGVLFVDDGSTKGTAARLESLAALGDGALNALSITINASTG